MGHLQMYSVLIPTCFAILGTAIHRRQATALRADLTRLRQDIHTDFANCRSVVQSELRGWASARNH